MVMEVMDLCCASLNQKNQFSIFLIGKLGCGSFYLLLDVPCFAILFLCYDSNIWVMSYSCTNVFVDLVCQDMSYCTVTGCNVIGTKGKPLVLKELKKLWNNEDPDLPWEQGEFSPSNTLLVDDSPYKALCNPVLSSSWLIYL